ncbi:hypothetical protein [Shewanella sp. UCD-KL12]|uniref:hypothetical protein n=1 Tax=Shewanella sp. UCD-KL12 TaxID=1917163 RepID=UPI0009711C2B|nr:hypothetical protein [Shewanella sp. UCD-KL12]
MAFKRIQTQTHQLGGCKLEVSYNRLTTRFKVVSEGRVLYSKLLLFWPIHRAKLVIGKTIAPSESDQYELKIWWFLLWSSQLSLSRDLSTPAKLVIPELLEIRRRRSLGRLIYKGVIGSVRLLVNLAS